MMRARAAILVHQRLGQNMLSLCTFVTLFLTSLSFLGASDHFISKNLP